MFLNKSKHGVIYFSLGTNVKSNRVSPSMKTAILEAFKELPYDILWKYDIDLPEASKNVKIVRWAPQQDVLSKILKNILFFILVMLKIIFRASKYKTVYNTRRTTISRRSNVFQYSDGCYTIFC